MKCNIVKINLQKKKNLEIQIVSIFNFFVELPS